MTSVVDEAVERLTMFAQAIGLKDFAHLPVISDENRGQFQVDLLKLTGAFSEAKAEVERGKYVPGVFRCAKCNFRLIQSTLNANTGAVSARDAPGEKCPNDGSPMWRVTWAEDLEDAYDRWAEQVKRAVEAEAQFTTLQSSAARDKAEIERLKPLVGAALFLHAICNAPSSFKELDYARDLLLRSAHAFARATLTDGPDK